MIKESYHKEGIKKMMDKSKLHLQSPDFEDRLMEQIIEEKAQQKSFWKNIKLSWLFFWIGAFFGLAVTTFVSNIEFSFWGMESKLPFYIFQVIIVLVIASQFDTLLRITLKKKERQI